MILVVCDGCKAQVNCTWNNKTNLWHIPEKWAAHIFVDHTGVTRHACSDACHRTVRMKHSKEGSPEARRMGLRVISGGS